jgi:hypothetical protein
MRENLSAAKENRLILITGDPHGIEVGADGNYLQIFLDIIKY